MWRARVRRLTLARCAVLLTLVRGVPDAVIAAEDPHPNPLPQAGEGMYEWQLPRGFPIPAVPADNAMSTEKVRLGRLLFYDRILSVNGEYACASCHAQSQAFTDGRARAVGATGEIHPRSAMSLANVAYNPTFTWTDAGFTSLESQAAQPLYNEHPIEMGLKGSEHAVVEKLAADDVYRDLFARSFPGEIAPITMVNVIRALASFERTLVSGRSAFDHFVFDDERAALDESAKRGMALFYSERIGCGQCHSGITFSGPISHAKQPGVEPSFVETGAGRFRVPTLRNVAVTAPYRHDGRFASLGEVIDHYAAGGEQVAPDAAAPKDERLRGFALDPAEKTDLVAFLKSLTDREFLADSRFGPPPP